MFRDTAALRFPRPCPSAIMSATLLTAAVAEAQWNGFSDKSAELGTSTFSFTGTLPEMVNSNENYYDGDFADFDRDGLSDRALGARYGLLHNTGGGVMTPFAGYTGFLLRGMPGATGWGEDAFQWADVDADGDFDVWSGGNGEPLVLQLNEAGRFRIGLQLGVSALGIVSIDLENDGDVDFAVTHSFCSDASCGHGCPDVSCAPGWPQSFVLLINDGAGSFSTVSSDQRGLPPGSDLIMALAAGDVDGDRDADVVFLNGVDRRFNVAKNDGTGSFATASVDFGVPVRAIGPISSGFHQGTNLGDIDADGDLDVVAALDRDIGTHPNIGHAIFVNQGDGSFSETSATAFDVGTFSGFLRGGNGKLFDADYDGDLDFIAFDRDTARLDVFLSETSGRFTYRPDLSMTLGTGAVALGNDTDVVDLDRDGSYDLWVGSGGADVRTLINSHVAADGLPADSPRNLRLASSDAAAVTLEWQAPPFAATARYYKVYRATSPGLEDRDRRLIKYVGQRHQDEGFSAPITPSTTTAYLNDPQVTLDGSTRSVRFTDSSVTPGATYYYAVSHVGPENVESRQTAEVIVPIPSSAPGTDTQAPSVDIVSPTSQDWSAYPRIVVHYSDDQGGVDPSSVRVSFNQALGGGARAPGADLSDLAYRKDTGVLILQLPETLPLPSSTLAELTVTVADLAGNSATERVSLFVVSQSAGLPTADFTAAPTAGDAPLTVRLDASGSDDSDGKILSWEWYLGDALTGVGRTFSHVFQAGGTYSVRLVVRDNEGGIASTTRTVTVAGPAPPCSLGEVRQCYTGASGTLGVGPCTGGLQSCVGGAWGACGGEVVPSGEICENTVDDDCDGLLDSNDVCGTSGMGGADGGAAIGGAAGIDAGAGVGGAGGASDSGSLGGAAGSSTSDAGTDAGDSAREGGSDGGCGCETLGGRPKNGVLVTLFLLAAFSCRLRRSARQRPVHLRAPRCARAARPADGARVPGVWPPLQHTRTEE